MDFEKKLKELETLAVKLEGSEVGLEEGIKMFERGVSLTAECLSDLKEKKGRITQIKKELDALIEEPFLEE